METVKIVLTEGKKIPEKSISFTEEEFSPFSKKILENVNKDDLILLKRNLFIDNEKINLTEKKDEEIDDDYLSTFSPQSIGSYFELFIAYKSMCPLCQNRLKKFKSKNFPTYDLVCLQGHLFQIKCSNSYNYFSKKNNTITIGNSSVSQKVFQVSDEIAPIYVCIQYTLKENEIKIDQNKSFVVIPNYHNPNDKPFYLEKGKNIYGQRMITWDKTTSTIFPITLMFLDTKISSLLSFNEVTTPTKPCFKRKFVEVNNKSNKKSFIYN